MKRQNCISYYTDDNYTGTYHMTWVAVEDVRVECDDDWSGVLSLVGMIFYGIVIPLSASVFVAAAARTLSHRMDPSCAPLGALELCRSDTGQRWRALPGLHSMEAVFCYGKWFLEYRKPVLPIPK